MKNLLILLLCLLCIPAYALKLEGEVEVKYTIEDAKREAFKMLPGKPDLSGISPVDPDFKLHQKMLRSGVKKTPEKSIAIYNDGSYTVSYFGQKYGYEYNKNGFLTAVFRIKKPVGTYLNKSIKYKYPSGEIELIQVSKSPRVSYAFYPDGKLWAHWDGEYCYDDKGNLREKRELVDD